MRISSVIACLLAALVLGATAEQVHAGLFVSVTVAPPPLVAYAQPPVPGPGYIWAPGYWAWDGEAADYYWVPGAWVPAPEAGLVWTPGYWGWSNGVYVWNAGYWGDHAGFYGGIDYGFGYTGVGFAGGYWSGGAYYYNRSVTNIGRPGGIANVYSKAVPEGSDSKISFNGGNGGVRAQPTVLELEAASERHVGPSADQLKHQELAAKNPDLKLSKNHGRPSIAATAKAGDFSKASVFGAKSGKGTLRPAVLTADPRPGAQRLNAVREAEHPGSGALNRGGAGNRTTAAHFSSVVDRYRAEDRRTVRGDGRPGDVRLRGGDGRPGNVRLGGDARLRGDGRPGNARLRGEARPRGDGWPGDAWLRGDARRPIEPASASMSRTRRPPGPRPAAPRSGTHPVIKAPPKTVKKAG